MSPSPSRPDPIAPRRVPLRLRVIGCVRKIIGEPGPKMVRVAVARHEPEEQLLLSMLHDAGIPARAIRTGGFHSPEMLASGPRDILVPEHFELDARSVVQPIADDIRMRDYEDREEEERR